MNPVSDTFLSKRSVRESLFVGSILVKIVIENVATLKNADRDVNFLFPTFSQFIENGGNTVKEQNLDSPEHTGRDWTF